jgi:hypothetical protein
LNILEYAVHTLFAPFALYFWFDVGFIFTLGFMFLTLLILGTQVYSFLPLELLGRRLFTLNLFSPLHTFTAIGVFPVSPQLP